MPLRAIISTLVAALFVLEQLLACNGADGRDLGIRDTEFVCVVEHWVHVECRVFRLAAQQS